MATPAFKPLNTTQNPPNSFPFTFHIPPRTDLFRKPPTTDDASQPTFYVPVVLKSLYSVTLKIKKIPNESHLYDQVGIAFLWANNPAVWFKAGVEYYEEQLRRSVVAPGFGGWSDWSVSAPVDSNLDIVVEAYRGDEGRGAELVFKVDGVIIRQIEGFFTPQSENDELHVGIFGARPADVDSPLEVEIADFQLVLV